MTPTSLKVSFGTISLPLAPTAGHLMHMTRRQERPRNTALTFLFEHLMVVDLVMSKLSAMPRMVSGLPIVRRYTRLAGYTCSTVPTTVFI